MSDESTTRGEGAKPSGSASTQPEAQAPVHSFFATCPAGLEGVLGAELRTFGCRQVRPLQGGVSFSGTNADAYRACLWSRTASRILRTIGRVSAGSAEALYAETQGSDWPGLFSPEKTIAVYAKGTNDALRNTQFTALKVKDAVCDSFRAAGLRRPTVDTGSPDVRLHVTVHRRKATIYVDYAGDSLHRRGYRASLPGKSHEAPLKEALAAGLVLWAGWDQSQLYDPVCGSGTLVLEAAMIATDMAPGLLRSKWGFEGLSDFDEAEWSRLLSEADLRFEAGLETSARLLGSDIDPDAIAISEAAAKTMGLSGVARFLVADCADMDETMSDFGLDLQAVGLVVMNPPYGVRLLEGETGAFYRKLARGLGQLGTEWRMAAITPDPLFDVQIGLDAQREQKTYNGPIETTFRLYELGASTFRSLDAVSLSGRELTVPVSSAHPEQFAARLRKTAKQARRWAKRQNVGAFRIYDRDLPDYSVSIDEYTDSRTGDVHLMIAEYKAPGEIDPVKAARRFDDAVRLATAILEVDERCVHTRMRRRDAGGSQYADARTRRRGTADSRACKRDASARACKRNDVEGPRTRGRAAQHAGTSQPQAAPITVREGGHVFEVHMEGALDTGLFLDHRPVREMIQAQAQGKRFLNLFAYTGSVSVYAAAGGAASTATVDMNRGYLEWARRNMEANGFAGRRHEFVRADVLDWIDRAQGEYDLVFLDPPTFSNSKAMKSQNWDIQRDYLELLSKVRRLMAPGATLYFSGNLRSFKMDVQAAEGLGFSVEDITGETIPEDFRRNPRIHFCYRLTADRM